MVLNVFDKIFTDIVHLFDFFIENNILEKYIRCAACDNISELKIFKRGERKTILYRCQNTSCRKKKSLTSSKLELPKIVHIIYFLLNDAKYKQLSKFYDIADSTINSIMKNLHICYKLFCDKRPIFLGGLKKIVEADETVFSRRGIIRYPTSTDDEFKDTIWILGAVDSVDKSHFFLKRVKK
ncbi:hypothetical protein DMUE_0371 [Dictyocoela muelleri]|nr:hypothetical protein DMUE_0371 [Dictyocoela muelleri]